MARLTGNIILTLLLVLKLVPSMAQIRYTVIDATDGKPVAGASVCDFYGRWIAKADDEGRFFLTNNGVKRLMITSVGYKSQEFSVVDSVGEHTIRMEQDVLLLGEVTVKAKRERYKRKGNPAVELMRKVIASMKKNDLRNKDYYRYLLYQKITGGFNDLKQEDLQKGLFKNRPWLNNHLEISQYNNKLTMPLMVEETISEKLFRKTPYFKKTQIHGHKISGVSNLFQTGDIINVLLKDLFTDIDITDDQIRFLNQSFTSPIGNGAISFYHYYLTDTISVDNDSCIQVDFFPANQQDFGFRGKLFVMADTSYQIKRCEMTFPKNSDVNWIENLKCIQEYAPLRSGEWVLVKDDMFAELEITRAAAKAFVTRNTRRRDYSFSLIPDTLVKGNYTTNVSPNAECRDEGFWKEYRGDLMTRGEQYADSLIPSMRKLHGFRYLMVGLRALFENFIETGSNGRPSKLDIGPVFSMVSNNFYDGLRLRIGGQTTASFHPHVFLKGYGAYGTKSKNGYYDTQLIYSFRKPKYQPNEYPKQALTIEFMRDVALPSDKFQKSDKDNIFSSVKTDNVDKMFLYARQSLRLDYEFLQGLKLYGELKSEKQYPVGNISFRPLASNNSLNSIRCSEGTIGIRYAPHETFLTTKQQRYAINYSSPIIKLQHTTGIPDLLGGQYTYNYTELEIAKPIWLPLSFGCIGARMLIGIQWNQVPYPLLIMPASNMSYLLSANTFNLINNMEFINDRSAMIEVGWDMNGKIFNRIPILKKLKCREFIGAKCLWGTLTDKNNPLLEENRESNLLMEFPNRCYTMDGNKPYWELSFGVHNIFNILRIEYIKRLNYLYLPTSRKSILKFSIDFKF